MKWCSHLCGRKVSASLEVKDVCQQQGWGHFRRRWRTGDAVSVAEQTLLCCPESPPSSALRQPAQGLNLASPSLQVRKLIKIIRFSLLFRS